MLEESGGALERYRTIIGYGITVWDVRGCWNGMYGIGNRGGAGTVWRYGISGDAGTAWKVYEILPD